MSPGKLLSLIDAEIARLKQTRVLIAAKAERLPGRPKSIATPATKTKQKRGMSPKTRQRIVEAQRRWRAAQKGAGK
jgi:hypothetical protein